MPYEIKHVSRNKFQVINHISGKLHSKENLGSNDASVLKTCSGEITAWVRIIGSAGIVGGFCKKNGKLQWKILHGLANKRSNFLLAFKLIIG